MVVSQRPGREDCRTNMKLETREWVPVASTVVAAVACTAHSTTPVQQATNFPGTAQAALGLTRLMAKMLFGVTTYDPLTFCGRGSTVGIGRSSCLLHSRCSRHAGQPGGGATL